VTVVRLDLAYDGSGFHGWARQPGVRTVEGALSAALERVLRVLPALAVAGRTDAGVHARGQVASFALDGAVDPGRLQRAVNGILAPEVVITRAVVAPDGFDARFSATAREYRYRISVEPWPDPFAARFVWHLPQTLALGAMRRGARGLVGRHDFASFCRIPQRGGTVRDLQRLSVARRGGLVEIGARANAFCHQMVRSLVGTLVAVGEGRIEPEAMAAILAARDRRFAGPVAPAHGLTLERVLYGRRLDAGSGRA
jgi:tRNA pseudouridine38-40 synthase